MKTGRATSIFLLELSFVHTERHISIQAKLEDLEMLVDLTGGEFRGSSSWLG